MEEPFHDWNEPEQHALRAALSALEDAEAAANSHPNAFEGDLGRAGAAIHLIRFSLECNAVLDPEDAVLLFAK